jgi:SAM-dependent methyltransferase
MSDTWYEFASVDHFWMRWRTRVLVHSLKLLNLEGKYGLDIGCGRAVLMRDLESKLSLVMDGCDLNVSALSVSSPGKGRILQYNILDRNPELLGRYDFVTLIDVIEHLEDDAGFLNAAKEYVKPGGYLIVNVPALPKLYDPYDKAVGHLRRYKLESLTAVFDKAGVELVDTFYWGFTLVPLLVARTMMYATSDGDDIIRRGFQPPRPWLNSALNALGVLEVSLSTRWPIGSSAVGIGRVRK